MKQSGVPKSQWSLPPTWTEARSTCSHVCGHGHSLWCMQQGSWGLCDRHHTAVTCYLQVAKRWHNCFALCCEREDWSVVGSMCRIYTFQQTWNLGEREEKWTSRRLFCYVCFHPICEWVSERSSRLCITDCLCVCVCHFMWMWDDLDSKHAESLHITVTASVSTPVSRIRSEIKTWWVASVLNM